MIVCNVFKTNSSQCSRSRWTQCRFCIRTQLTSGSLGKTGVGAFNRNVEYNYRKPHLSRTALRLYLRFPVHVTVHQSHKVIDYRLIVHWTQVQARMQFILIQTSSFSHKCTVHLMKIVVIHSIVNEIIRVLNCPSLLRVIGVSFGWRDCIKSNGNAWQKMRTIKRNWFA